MSNLFGGRTYEEMVAEMEAEHNAKTKAMYAEHDEAIECFKVESSMKASVPKGFFHGYDTMEEWAEAVSAEPTAAMEEHMKHVHANAHRQFVDTQNTLHQQMVVQQMCNINQ